MTRPHMNSKIWKFVEKHGRALFDKNWRREIATVLGIEPRLLRVTVDRSQMRDEEKERIERAVLSVYDQRTRKYADEFRRIKKLADDLRESNFQAASARLHERFGDNEAIEDYLFQELARLSGFEEAT